MPRCCLVLSMILSLAGAFPQTAVRAAVIVVANRSSSTVTLRLLEPDVAPLDVREFKIESGDVVPLPVGGPTQLSYDVGDQRKDFQVAPGCMYLFNGTSPGRLALRQIGLSHETATSAEPMALDLPLQRVGTEAVSTSAVVIPVKVLFDEDEVTPLPTWERRIRARLDAASRLFKKQCFVQFQIVAVESWRSNDGITNLDQALSEFEHAVDPAPARLAIGFSGQYKASQKYPHLGGTRGPLHTHLLIREWANHNTEVERLEVLVHELGHFLGAVHSPESNSVMRTVLGDRQARAVAFRIGFDPLNTLAMCLVSQELRERPLVRLAEMQPSTQATLRDLYAELARALPQDPSAVRYLRLLAPLGQLQTIPHRP